MIIFPQLIIIFVIMVINLSVSAALTCLKETVVFVYGPFDLSGFWRGLLFVQLLLL